MADFESIIRNHVGEDGNVPADAIAKLAKAISTTVGNEFVEKTRYKAKLEEIDTLKGEKQTAEDSATTAEKWKTKYNALKEDFDQYKKDQTAKETRGAKEKAYRDLLKDVGISEKRLEKVLQLCNVDGVELDDKGIIKGADKLKEALKEDWSDFIVTTDTKGATIANPPANNGNGSTMTKEQIMNIKDAGARQKAIAENPALFGI